MEAKSSQFLFVRVLIELLSVYTKNRWHFAKINIDFRTGKCDIAQINYFLSALIVGLPTDKKFDLGRKNYNSGNREANPLKKGSFGILGNSWEIDSLEIEGKLRTDPCLLLDEEKVLRAFQSGRDIDVYTDRRLIIIDTQGMTGKRVKYKVCEMCSCFFPDISCSTVSDSKLFLSLSLSLLP